MKWNKYTLKTRTEAEDLISSMMQDVGIEGIEIEDKVPLSQREKEQMFVDILPEGPADDGVAYISFYLEPDADQEEMLDKLPFRHPRLRTRTGLTTGKSSSISFMWMTF